MNIHSKLAEHTLAADSSSSNTHLFDKRHYDIVRRGSVVSVKYVRIDPLQPHPLPVLSGGVALDGGHLGGQTTFHLNVGLHV